MWNANGDKQLLAFLLLSRNRWLYVSFFFLWRRVKCYLKYILKMIQTFPSKTKILYPICAVLILKVRKISKGFSLLYLHAKAKAHPIRFEGIIYSVQSQGLLWKKAQIQKEKRKAAITNQTGLGRNGRKKFRSNVFFKASIVFDFLFPDSPHDLFYCE